MPLISTEPKWKEMQKAHIKDLKIAEFGKLKSKHNMLLLRWKMMKKETPHQIECANALVIRIDDMREEIDRKKKELGLN